MGGMRLLEASAGRSRVSLAKRYLAGEAVTPEEVTSALEQLNAMTEARERWLSVSANGRIEGTLANVSRATTHRALWLREGKRIVAEHPGWLRDLHRVAANIRAWCRDQPEPVSRNRNGAPYSEETIYRFLLKHTGELAAALTRNDEDRPDLAQSPRISSSATVSNIAMARRK